MQFHRKITWGGREEGGRIETNDGNSIIIIFVCTTHSHHHHDHRHHHDHYRHNHSNRHNYNSQLSPLSPCIPINITTTISINYHVHYHRHHHNDKYNHHHHYHQQYNHRHHTNYPSHHDNRQHFHLVQLNMLLKRLPIANFTPIIAGEMYFQQRRKNTFGGCPIMSSMFLENRSVPVKNSGGMNSRTLYRLQFEWRLSWQNNPEYETDSRPSHPYCIVYG